MNELPRNARKGVGHVLLTDWLVGRATPRGDPASSLEPPSGQWKRGQLTVRWKYLAGRPVSRNRERELGLDRRETG